MSVPEPRRPAISDPVIGRIRFVDGTELDVYRAADGRQYVTGYDNESVYGVWVLTAEAEEDAPMIVLK